MLQTFLHFKISKFALRFKPNVSYNTVDIVVTGKNLFALQKIQLTLTTFFQIFPANAIISVDTPDTFLFATFCSAPTAQVMIFNKLVYI